MCRGQLLEYILQEIVQAAGRECGVVDKAGTYSVWSHRAAMVFVQLAAARAPGGRRVWVHAAGARRRPSCPCA
jgi:hypothetical protein